MKALIIVLVVYAMMYLIPIMLYAYGVSELKKKRRKKREVKTYRYEKPSLKQQPIVDINDSLISVNS